MLVDGDSKRININGSLLKKKVCDKTLKVKSRIKATIRITTIKKDQIKMIKNKQNSIVSETKSKNITASEEQIGIGGDDFENDFMKSMKFLDTIIKEKKETRQNKKSLKKKWNKSPIIQSMNPVPMNPVPMNPVPMNPVPMNPVPMNPVPMNPVPMNPVPMKSLSISTHKLPTNPVPMNIPPKYSCLKNGSKPCYREFHNKTLKKNISFNAGVDTGVCAKPINAMTPRKSNKTRVKKRLIKKHTYKVGKIAKNRTISVLIKNNLTRRRVMNDLNKIKHEPISNIKQALYKKNLLKIGSTCPPDVIREIYEQSMLAGDVNNIGKGVTYHNFIATK